MASQPLYLPDQGADDDVSVALDEEAVLAFVSRGRYDRPRTCACPFKRTATSPISQQEDQEDTIALLTKITDTGASRRCPPLLCLGLLTHHTPRS